MAQGSASLAALLVGLFVAVLALSSATSGQTIFGSDYFVKWNATGLCNGTNLHCDWYVGVWTATYHYAVYSCGGNGDSTQPSNISDMCCTTPYTVPAICVNGYRKGDFSLVEACVFQESRFANMTDGNLNERTLVRNSVRVIQSFENGVTVDGHCSPFRQLSHDSYVASATPLGIRDAVRCPEFPVGEAYCDDSSLGVSNFVKARRRIPAARDSGYRIYRDFNSQSSCSIHNGNCDWIVGSWTGYTVAQGFSAVYTEGEGDSFIPYFAADVRCALNPFTVPVECNIGYSTITGRISAFCQYDTARVIPVNKSYGVGKNGVIHTKSFNQYAEFDSLHNGVNIALPDGRSVCTPMDRYDSDTFVFNTYPSFPFVNCSEYNLPPDLEVRCVEDGDSSVHVSYTVLVRTYGSGGPAAYASIAQKAEDYVFLFSSASTLVSSLSAVLVSFLLLWE